MTESFINFVNDFLSREDVTEDEIQTLQWRLEKLFYEVCRLKNVSNFLKEYRLETINNWFFTITKIKMFCF